MGNRAHVIFTDKDEIGPAIYLHWNGGPESIYNFLAELELRGVRHDTSYSTARFIQLVGEFFGSSGDGAQYSLGVTNGPSKIDTESLAPFDVGDNGVFVVSWTPKGKQRVQRWDSTYEHGLRKLSQIENAREKREAETHRYAEQFREFFNKARAARLAIDESGTKAVKA